MCRDAPPPPAPGSRGPRARARPDRDPHPACVARRGRRPRAGAGPSAIIGIATRYSCVLIIIFYFNIKLLFLKNGERGSRFETARSPRDRGAGGRVLCAAGRESRGQERRFATVSVRGPAISERARGHLGGAWITSSAGARTARACSR